MLDIDHFKRINDSHGHSAGDQVIRAVASLCAELKRPSDSLGRLGGEEFALLLPETGEADAARAARRLCDAVRGMTVPHDPPIRVTASFGVAEIAADRMTSAAWLSAADAALYDAKRGGRDRVAISPVAALRVA